MKRHIQKGRTKLQFSMKGTNLLSQCHKSDNDNNTQKKKTDHSPNSAKQVAAIVQQICSTSETISVCS